MADKTISFFTYDLASEGEIEIALDEANLREVSLNFKASMNLSIAVSADNTVLDSTDSPLPFLKGDFEQGDRLLVYRENGKNLYIKNNASVVHTEKILVEKTFQEI